MKKKMSLMIVVILILQIMLPMLTVIWENALTLKSVAYDGTEYYINSAQDMWDFAEKVNSGDTFEGVTVYLNNDIDLGCDENKQWVPIGDYSNNNTFKGIFDGKSHTISGMKINAEQSNYIGFFGYLNRGVIKNLIISDSEININNSEITINRIGIIAGMLINNSKIENCGTKNSKIILTSKIEENNINYGDEIGGLVRIFK